MRATVLCVVAALACLVASAHAAAPSCKSVEGRFGCHQKAECSWCYEDSPESGVCVEKALTATMSTGVFKCEVHDEMPELDGFEYSMDMGYDADGHFFSVIKLDALDGQDEDALAAAIVDGAQSNPYGNSSVASPNVYCIPPETGHWCKMGPKTVVSCAPPRHRCCGWGTYNPKTEDCLYCTLPRAARANVVPANDPNGRYKCCGLLTCGPWKTNRCLTCRLGPRTDFHCAPVGARCA